MTPDEARAEMEQAVREMTYGHHSTPYAKVFISGPHGMNWSNTPAFEEAKIQLRAVGLFPVTEKPLVLDHGGVLSPVSYDWQSDCIEALRDSDGVALLPGWDKSPGAMCEVGAALALDKPVADLNWWTGVGARFLGLVAGTLQYGQCEAFRAAVEGTRGADTP